MKTSLKLFCIMFLFFCFISNKMGCAQNNNVFSIEGGIPFGWKNNESRTEEGSSTKEYKNVTFSFLYSRVIKKQVGIEAGMNFTMKGNALCSEHYTGNARWISVLAGANYSFPLSKNFYLIPFADFGVVLVEYGQQWIGLVTYYVDYNEIQLAPGFKGGLRLAYELGWFRFSFSLDYEHLFIREKDLKYYSQSFYDYKASGLQYSFNSYNAKLSIGFVF